MQLLFHIMGNENLKIKLVLSYIGLKYTLTALILHLDLLLLPNPTVLSVLCTAGGNKWFPTFRSK